MKTTGADSSAPTALAVLAATSAFSAEAPPTAAANPRLAATGDLGLLERARSFAQPLLLAQRLDTGEPTAAHAQATADLLAQMGAATDLQAATWLVYACDHLNRPREVLASAFNDSLADLAVQTTHLVRVQRQARDASLIPGNGVGGSGAATQTENIRKMLLAFSRDLRVVLMRLASRLQTLRWHAASKTPVDAALAHESLTVFAPLANRLGIWQIKWELEDLAFRFLEPHTYKQVAVWLDEKRVEREASVQRLRDELAQALGAQGLQAEVHGRPKHIYSIVKKMRGKSLGFAQVYDVRALRVVVDSVPACYQALAWVHAHYAPELNEFDDYIARPKANGYQSLHTVVRDAGGQAFEIQIRTHEMHAHAEHGVAAHWAYKEAGTQGYAGVRADGEYDARLAVLRQLLAWQRDLADATSQPELFDDRIYVLTPDAAIVDLPQGATPVDFAYAVHTSLGHRCRGARIDGVLLPLNTALKNGQTVDVVTAREGGPSRDWLNAELGFLVSPRARAKVRAYFNALQTADTRARGRTQVEKALQREGKTAWRHEDLAQAVGLKTADEMYELLGKDELSVRAIENVLRGQTSGPASDEDLDAAVLQRINADRAPERTQERSSSARGGVLVVGVDSLLTQLAKCCRPAPPDAIGGFVTRGKGVSIHRSDCSNFRHLAAQHADRVIDVAWGAADAPRSGAGAVYPVDVAVQAQDRQGLLRDISDVLAREKTNVIAVATQSVRGTAWMTFTVEVSSTERLAQVLAQVRHVAGVQSARRR